MKGRRYRTNVITRKWDGEWAVSSGRALVRLIREQLLPDAAEDSQLQADLNEALDVSRNGSAKLDTVVAAIEDHFAVTKGRSMRRAAQFLRAEIGRELGDAERPEPIDTESTVSYASRQPRK